MAKGPNETAEMLERLIESKRNLVDTLVSKGEEASFDDPFDALVQKAGDYLPKSYILVDEMGAELPAALVSQVTVFDATENDVREGKVFASDTGVKTGSKFIPSYVTTEGYAFIPKGGTFVVDIRDGRLYDFTKFQAIICPYNNAVSKSVSAEKVAINNEVYAVNSTNLLSVITKDNTTKRINLGIINNGEKPYVLRYFTYKEVE